MVVTATVRAYSSDLPPEKCTTFKVKVYPLNETTLRVLGDDNSMSYAA